MTRTLKALAQALLIAGLGLSCATNPPTPAELPEAAQSSIQAEAAGLEPGGDSRFQKIAFSVEFGSPEAIKAWTVTIASQKGIEFTIKGEGAKLPENLAWDGRDTTGSISAEGSYTAKLDIDYGETFKPGKAESKPFVLVTAPPIASFAPNPGLFAYSPGVPPPPLSITVTARTTLAKVASWTIDVYDSKGDTFKTFTGGGTSSKIEWDGKGDAGSLLMAGATYPATLTALDEFGGKSVFKGSFALSDKPAAAAPSISMRRNGFSPASQSVKNSIDFLFSIPAKTDVSAWKLEVESATLGLVKTYSGGAANLPDFVRWDGKGETGELQAQGPYYPLLTLEYDDKFKPSQTKGPTVSLVMDSPTGSVTVDPPAPVLAELGPAAPLHFIVQAKSAYAQIAKWTMSVLDGKGTAVALFQANWPNNKVDWDGKTVDGGRMTPGASYEVVAKVEDEYGNVGTLRGTISVDALKPADEKSLISAASPGFAPKGDGLLPDMDFSIEAGDRDAVAAWKVEMLDAGGKAQYSFAGADSKVPSNLVWDGKMADGSWAPEGRYTARLALDYGLRFSNVTALTKPFVLDLTPPATATSLSTELFSPDGDGENDILTVKVEASSKLARLTAWTVNILDPEGTTFASFKGTWPFTSLNWDGRGSDGELVESASDYLVVAKVRDEFGNTGEATKSVGTDILVVKTADGYRIRVSSIVFKGFTADFVDVPAERATRNLQTLDLLGKKLAKFPDYRIALEGHAVMINWDDKTRGGIEQREILLPLSKARAEAIAAALRDRGIARDRLETIGLGAENPIVPDSDLANRWKNRRVEFILLK